MVTSNRPQGGNQGGSGGDNTTANNYTNTAGDYSDPDYHPDHDGDMDGMHYDHDGVLRRERMASRSTRTGATWEGERSSPYGEEWDEEDMEPSKFRSKARGIARGRGRSGGNSKRKGAGYGQENGGGDAIHELIPIYIPSPGMDSTISRGGSDPDGISGDTLAVIINNGGESHKHKEGEGKMYGSMDNFMAGLLAGGNGCGGNSNNNGGGFWGGDSLALIILLLLFGANGGGFGNGGLGGVAGVDRTIVNERNASLLMDAISSNGIRQENALTSLASNLNCSVGSIKDILCSLAQGQAIQGGNLQAAIESAKCSLSHQLSDCCCRQSNAIERQGCDIREAIAGVNYNLASQFAAQNNLIQSTAAASDRAMAERFCDLRADINAGFAGIESREQAREIASLRDQLAQERASAQTSILLSAINRNRAFTGQYDATTTSFTGAVGQVSQFGV